MEHDEHEMLIEYSEMTAFNFNSQEFQNVRRDYEECRNFASNFVESVKSFMNGLKPANNY